MKRILFLLLLGSALITYAQLPSYVPTSDLIAFYPMNGDAIDESPNSNTGAVYGPLAATDRFGEPNGCMSFDGSNDYISIPYSESIGAQQSFTASAWVYVDGGSCNPRVFELHENLNCGGYSMAFNGSSNGLKTFHTGQFGNCTGGVAITDYGGGIQALEWHHVAITFELGATNVARLYVDGVQVHVTSNSSSVGPINYYGAPLYIGNIAPNRCDWFGGKLDDLGFWNRALSPSEISALHNLDSEDNSNVDVPEPVPSDGLVAWYPLESNITNAANPGELDGISFNGSYITDRNGQANSAAGLPSNQLLQLPLNTAILSNEFTLSFWVYKRANIGHNAVQIAQHNGPGRANFGFTSPQNNGNPYISELTCAGTYGDCGYTGSTSEGGTPFNEWFHLAYVVDGINTKIYFNGNDLPLDYYNDCSLNFDCSDSGMSLWFGGDVGGGATEYFNGDFDDIGIWNRALSLGEVASLFSSDPPVYGCMTSSACNYDVEATVDDGSCAPPCNYVVPSYIPEDGLIAWLPFNGNAADESGNGHDGDVDGAVLSTDRFDNAESAYFFDGNDRIFPADPTDFPLAERTTSIWMKSQVPISGGRALFGYGGTGCGTSWLLTYNNQGNQPNTLNSFEIQGHCNSNSVSASLSTDEFQDWHQVVVRTSTAGTDIFIDGLLIAHSDTYVNNTGAGCAVIGAVPSTTGACYYQDASNALWHGWLDDVGIWNRALTDDEILTSFLAETPVYGCTNEAACNYDSEANLDDGSCIPSGCMEEGACNYNADAECEGESCDYSCCPGPGCCGEGMHWDAAAQTCVITPPSVAPDAECTLFNLQELAEGYQILLAQNAVQDSLILALQDSLSNCSNFTEDGSASAEGPCVGQNHVTFDGYDYSVVEIGDQCWFAENLRTASYSDGSALDAAHYAAFNNSSSSIDSYGLLYKGAAITDARNLCPTDWHISTLPDWQSLEAHATANGHDGAQAAALKSTSGWSTGNGSDAFGFNATPGGFHYNPIHPYWGEFAHSLTTGYWWTSTPHSTGRSYACAIQNNIGTPDYAYSNGLSVRCVKD